jgi:hypothetical protein
MKASEHDAALKKRLVSVSEKSSRAVAKPLEVEMNLTVSLATSSVQTQSTRHASTSQEGAYPVWSVITRLRVQVACRHAPLVSPNETVAILLLAAEQARIGWIQGCR